MNWVNTFIYSNKIGVRISRHLAFWISDIINYLLVISINNEINLQEIFRIVLRIPLIALATYFVIYYLIPKFSKKLNPGELILWIIGVLIYLGLFVHYYRYYMLEPLVNPSYIAPENIWDFRRILNNEILSSFMVMGMATTIKLVKNKTELQTHNEKLEKEKKLAELNFLKAQMQPHFLFNTLNTLYSETIQDSGKAQQVILHLSNLLRFILDECDKDRIPLSHEIKVIKDLVALEQLRHGERLHVTMKIHDIDNAAFTSPLIFIPFIENSFKHSLNNQRGNIQIDIELFSYNGMITLNVSNNFTISQNDTKGKGIENTKRQLDLLFGEDYSLDVTESNNKYNVTLSVPVLSKGDDKD